jgi:hypothetical protein
VVWTFFLLMRCTGAATLIAAATWPLWSRIGRRDAAQPDLDLLVVDRVALRRIGRARRERIAVGDGVVGVALEAVVDHLLHDLGGW